MAEYGTHVVDSREVTRYEADGHSELVTEVVVMVDNTLVMDPLKSAKWAAMESVEGNSFSASIMSQDLKMPADVSRIRVRVTHFVEA